MMTTVAVEESLHHAALHGDEEMAEKNERLAGLQAGMVVFSSYPADPRPRRILDALLREGMKIDLICQAESGLPRRQSLGPLTVTRIPIRNARGGALSYAWQYFSFILAAAVPFAWRRCRHRYDLIYVHNMPDILVLAGLLPKLFGAKVILDQHDPMPELLMTIFNKKKTSASVRMLRLLERWSFLCADRVFTVNEACRKIFAARSCRAEKLHVIMNCPDEALFPYVPAALAPRRGAQDPFVVMYHGSLVERNGLLLAVEAFAHLIKNVPQAELRIFGPRTPYLDQTLEYARARGVDGHIRYLGPRRLENLAEEIAQCDIGVVPNARNAFTEINTPTRIFEYLALGKPVVAPRTPGILDYFDAESLYFFDSGDAGDLARVMEEAALNPARTCQSAILGQQVYQNHTWRGERESLVLAVTDVLRRSAAYSRRCVSR
jgi:glycosyltransferase involved in cell wall biosynthesis